MRPATPAVVQHAPGIVVERVLPRPDPYDSFGGPGHMFRRVLEELVAPRHDHPQGLVPLREADEYVGLELVTAGCHTVGLKTRAAIHVGDLDSH